jgi:hypothetical protein
VGKKATLPKKNLFIKDDTCVNALPNLSNPDFLKNQRKNIVKDISDHPHLVAREIVNNTYNTGQRKLLGDSEPAKHCYITQQFNSRLHDEICSMSSYISSGGKIEKKIYTFTIQKD